VEMLVHDFSERFHGLKAIEFPSWFTPTTCSRFIACSIRATAIGITWVTARWRRENYFQGQRNHDVVVRGMRKEISYLEYFGKAKTGNDKFSVILFGRMWV